jgi:hypothetical protein
MISLIANNIGDVQKSLNRIAGSLKVAISGGVNEAANAGVNLTEQSVRDMIAIDNLRIQEAFHIRESTPQNMQCSIQVDERFVVDLSAFSAKQTSQGVAVQIYRFGSPTLYPGTFGPDTRLERGIYRRISKKRYPIRKIKSLDLMKETPVQERVRKMRDELPALTKLSIENNVNEIVNQG